MTKQKSPVPTTSVGDRGYAVVKAAVSSVPWIGGPLAELFQAVVTPPIDKRRQAWMEQIGEDMQKLQNEGLKIEDLQDNQQFISAVMHASQIAIRTHQQEKLEALRNAVRNVAVGRSPDDTRLNLFLDMVDNLDTAHIRLLKVFRSPPSMSGVMAGGLSMVIEKAMPEMRGQKELYEQLWKRLVADGLIADGGLNTTMSGSGLSTKRTTRLGDQLLDFITTSV